MPEPENKQPVKPADVQKQRREKDIAQFKGESHSYSNKRPIRKVLSRYAR